MLHYPSIASIRARAIASAPASPTSSSGRIVQLPIRSTAGNRPVLASAGSSAITVVSPPSGSGAVAITVSEPPPAMFRAEASSLRAVPVGIPVERVDQHDRVSAARRQPPRLVDHPLDGLGLGVRRDGEADRRHGRRPDPAPTR